MKKLLIVEDDPDILRTLATLLEDRYETSVAEDGRSALRRLQSEPYDLVILDLLMPVLDGAGLLKELRSNRSAVPVLLISAFPGLEARARELGIRHYLPKPFDIDELESMVAEILGVGGPNGVSLP